MHAVAGVQNAKEKTVRPRAQPVRSGSCRLDLCLVRRPPTSRSVRGSHLPPRSGCSSSSRPGSAWLYGSHVCRRSALDPWELPTSGGADGHPPSRGRPESQPSRSPSAASIVLTPARLVPAQRAPRPTGGQSRRAQPVAGPKQSNGTLLLAALRGWPSCSSRLWCWRSGSGASSGSRQSGWRAPGLRLLMAATVGSLRLTGCCLTVTPADDTVDQTSTFGGSLLTTTAPRAGSRSGGAEPPGAHVRRAGAVVTFSAPPNSLPARCASTRRRAGREPSPVRSPQPGWQPAASWPRPPKGWRLWTPVTAEVPSPSAADEVVLPSDDPLVRRSHKVRA